MEYGASDHGAVTRPERNHTEGGKMLVGIVLVTGAFVGMFLGWMILRSYAKNHKPRAEDRIER